jgi:hypothetical protein
MIAAAHQDPDTTARVAATLIGRVRNEYLEMPGLKLTPQQAARLWGVERAVSDQILAALANCGFLFRNRDGAYVRTSER